MAKKPRGRLLPHEEALVKLVVQRAKEDVPQELHSAIEFNIREIVPALSKGGKIEINFELENLRKILFDEFGLQELDLARQKQVLAWVKRKILESGRLPTEQELLEHRIVRIRKEQKARARILADKNRLKQELDLKVDYIMAESGFYQINQRNALSVYVRKVRPLPRTRNGLLEIIPKLISEEIRDGKTENLLKSGLISVLRKWHNPEVRRRVIRTLAEVLKLRPKELNGFYFNLFGLRTVLHFYDSSPGKAVVDAFGLKPWETSKVNSRFFMPIQTRVEAVRWLMEKTNKSLDELIQDDLLNYGLSGLLRIYTGNLTNLKQDLATNLK